MKDLSYSDLEKIIRHIGKTYKKSVLRKELNYMFLSIEEQHQNYKTDNDLIFMINTCLSKCSRDTRCIIENEFLKETENYWYLNYYTKSTFYRLKKKAIFEFANCMGL